MKLRTCRKKAGLSQSQLAEKVGISVRVYKKYEQGVCNIEEAQISLLLRICIVLECQMSDIFMNRKMMKLAKKYDEINTPVRGSVRLDIRGGNLVLRRLGI